MTNEYRKEWTKEEIIEFHNLRDDPVYFAEKMFDFKLMDHQKYFMNYKRGHLVKSNRCTGITTNIAMKSLYHAVTKRDQTIVVVARKYGWAAAILDIINDPRHNIKEKLKTIFDINITKRNTQCIEFDNGSQIIVLRTEAAYLKGRSINHFFMDNSEFVAKREFEEILEFIGWGMKFSDSTSVILCSTGEGMSKSKFDEYFDDVVNRKENCSWDAHVINYRELKE